MIDKKGNILLYGDPKEINSLDDINSTLSEKTHNPRRSFRDERDASLYNYP